MSSLNSTCRSVFEAVDFLRRGSAKEIVPKVGIILGSGLGGLAQQMEDVESFSYGSIPGFARSTASGHRGDLLWGQLESSPVIAMAGRFHRYEGWSNDQTTFPVRVMEALGVQILIVSNAAGGVNPRLKVGEIVILRDHMAMMSSASRGSSYVGNIGASPLATRCCRRSEIYDSQLRKTAMDAAMENGFVAREGTYLATLGPTYETRSEYRMMRKFGADVVGMSTVPEVIVAASLGMRVLGLSMVSNVAAPDRPVATSHDEVLAVGREAAKKMEAIVRAVIAYNRPRFRKRLSADFTD